MRVENLEDLYELSPMQEGILFHCLHSPDSGVYFIQNSFLLSSKLNVKALKQAWQRVIDSHSILRTSFHWQELDKPLQAVHRQAELPLEQYDWRYLHSQEQKVELDKFLQADRKRNFDLSKAPLMRLTLIQLADDVYQFVWSNHHLILDGWSMRSVLQEVSHLYEALDQGQYLPVLRHCSYGDYIEWLQQQDLSQAEVFWRKVLSGFLAPTSLGVDQSSGRLAEPSEDFAEQDLRLSVAATVALNTLARKNLLTLNTLVQGAWSLLLSRYSAEEDVVFGATVSSRPSTLADVESMVGLFINTLPVRVYVDPEKFLLPWLKQLQSQQIEQRQYEYSPLMQIQGWSDVPKGLPLFESIIVFENYPVNTSLKKLGESLKIDQSRVWHQTNYPFSLLVVPGSELSLQMLYDCRRFDAATITRMLGHLKTLLSKIAENAEQQLKDLSLLTPTEQHQLLVEWNNTQIDYPQLHGIHELFEAQVERTPDAVAVVFENVETLPVISLNITYRELNCRANQLAHHLRSLGVKSDVLVGICMERSLEMVVGLLGILKAGGAYVPLDPAYPQQRLDFMLEDANVTVLLTQQRLKGLLTHRAKTVFLDTDWDANAYGTALPNAQHSQDNLKSGVTDENLAYVIYTSGSTGKPKGAMNTHRGIGNRLLWMQDTYQLIAADRVLQKTPFSFDVSVWEFFLPLLNGASLVIARPGGHQDSAYLVKLIAQHQVTTLHFVPSMLQVFLLEQGLETCSCVRQVMCSGEALSFELQQRFQAHLAAQLHNLYGPTEAAIDVTFWACSQSNQQTVPIGTPIANTQIYLLDSQLMPVPIGVSGELYIGGTPLARGYLNRPDLTALAFIPNHFSSDPGTRLYKTGDLARYLPDGSIEYIGRTDHQVKIRGFRIELGEIEAVVSQHPNVLQAVVIDREDITGDQRLVAYLVPNQEPTPTINDLRYFLKQQLPEYMIPSAFVMLETLPLTSNGKIDRRALPEPIIDRSDLENTLATPRTLIEDLLAGIWAQVLGIEHVSIHDNFLELGGHSLYAIQVVSRLYDSFQVKLPLRSLFESLTIVGLAKHIETAMGSVQTANIPLLERVSRDEKLPLSFAQQRLWVLDQLQPGSFAYNIPTAVRMRGTLNLTALKQSLDEIVRRHEVLRTTFTTVADQPVQIIHPIVTLTLAVIDLRELTEFERETETQRLATVEAQRPFNLTQGPLLHAYLLQLAEAEHIILFTMHHIIADAWSMGVIIQELAVLYEAFCNGKLSPLPELPIQYVDFAVWQRQWLQGEILETQLTYWQQQLAGLSVLQLPVDYSQPIVHTFRGATQSFSVSRDLTDTLKRLSRQEGVTLFMTLLAIFQTLLHRHTKQEDIAIGTDIANRNKAEIDKLIGFFVNLLILRTDLSGNPSFQDLLRRVREVTLGAYAHQDLPFEQLVGALRPERRGSQTPLCRVLLVMNNLPMMPTLTLSGLNLSPLPIDNTTSKFDIALFITETEHELLGTWQYNADLFKATTIAQMSEHFQRLLVSVTAQPEARINALEMLTEAEKKKQVMEEAKQEENKFKQFKKIKPKAVRLPQGELIEVNNLQHGQTLPRLMQPKVKGFDLIDWALSHREFIDTELLKHGAILFRGFNLNSVSVFEKLAQAICPELFCEYGDLPRVEVSGKVYSSTPYPPDKAILFHNESSHLHYWPLKIWFFCVQPANQGGETPIVDCRQVYQILDPKLKEQFEKKQLMYVRNYTAGLDVSWQKFFGTTNKAVVEDYCRQAGIDFEWKENNGLKTRKIRPAIAKHPMTGEQVFFNQLQLHHVSCLDSVVQNTLLSTFGEENLPRNVYYGDGSPIENSVIEEIREVYQVATISFPWQQGDVLMLDNMLTAHGRNPYVGSRNILVAMGEMICEETYAG